MDHCRKGKALKDGVCEKKRKSQRVDISQCTPAAPRLVIVCVEHGRHANKADSASGNHHRVDQCYREALSTSASDRALEGSSAA
jgi:hypothetical protein